jgi:hypothetical protein
MQEVLALSIVAIAALITLFRLYRSYLAQPVSHLLLKRGKVKLAMKVRAQAETAGCGNCGDSNSGCH